MKVTLERATLLKSLNHVHRVVERRNTIPILSNVLLRAEGGDLIFKATDLDLEVLETAPAMVEVGGATTVPAHMLYDIVRKLPDGSEVMLAKPMKNRPLMAISRRPVALHLADPACHRFPRYHGRRIQQQLLDPRALISSA